MTGDRNRFGQFTDRNRYGEFVKQLFPQYMRPLKKFNVELARKTLDYAREEHDDFIFDMEVWYNWVKRRNSEGETMCKTRACLAGTAIHLSPEITEIKPEQSGRASYPVFTYQGVEHVNCAPELGKELLGLSKKQANRLFFETGDNETALNMLQRMVELAEQR